MGSHEGCLVPAVFANSGVKGLIPRAGLINPKSFNKLYPDNNYYIIFGSLSRQSRGSGHIPRYGRMYKKRKKGC